MIASNSNYLIDVTALLRLPHAKKLRHLSHLCLLLHLKQMDKSVTSGEAATALAVSTAATTGIIDSLEKGGWVERVLDSRDRRIRRVKLTDKGAELASAITP